ncbi:ASFV G ACD 00350 [African swine fever virus]|nr:ASFV G ACD 00350 [African swine fever virus]WNO18173.1 ASFV G ACD 00350 [African swine fever virus]WNO18366.1 ASFV G ACD 00350 [African swine fever virus]WOS60379.1 ASFV G ACD 00350 [African swine fever virus]
MIHYFLQLLGGGSLIALALLWFADYYVEFIEARLDSNITAV